MNNIAERDVELHGNPRFLEKSQKLDSDTFVVRIFLDSLTHDTAGIELDPIVIDGLGADLPGDCFEVCDGIFSSAQKINISRGTRQRCIPHAQEQSALQDEPVSKSGPRETNKKALQAIELKNFLERA